MERVPVQQSNSEHTSIHAAIEPSLPAYIDSDLYAGNDPGFCNCVAYISTLGPESPPKIRDIGPDA
jgi:hypothetical protein